MPTLTFKGFTTGSSVALSAAQGANSSSGSTSNWGQANLGSVAIQTIAPSAITAPAVIGFEAINASGFTLSTPPANTFYDPAFHELTYFWTVNGRPYAPYLAPRNMVGGPSNPEGWNNPDRAYGKKIAFHFPEAGTFDVSLWAVDRNGVQSDVVSTQIIVLEPDVIFPGTQTVCYSNDPEESWVGEKAGCQRATSFAQLTSAIGNASAPLRILFKRGQEYLQSEVQRLRITGAGDYLNFVGAWGSGAKPIIHGLDSLPIFEMYNAVHATDFMTFDNLDFRGDWDTPSETGVATYSPFQFWSNDKDVHFAVCRCDFSGFSLIHGTPGETASFIGFADCVVTNWQDMGIFYQDGPSAFVAKIGCRLQQNVDAGNGPPNGEGKNGLYNQHGCMRYGDIKHFYVASCDMFSRSGWFDRTDQPCMRMVTNGFADNSFIIERVVCEGGSDTITMSGNNGSTPESPGNYLIDRALLLGTAMTFRSFIYAEYGGLTVRNTLGIVPDVPGFKINTWNGSVYMTGSLGPDANEDGPVQVYGNTFVNLQSSANDPGHVWTDFVDAEGFNNVTRENNLTHGPDLDAPINAEGPLDLTQPITGISPRYKGILFNEFGQENGTLSSSVANGGSFTVAYPAGTDQAYWLALPASDDRHTIRLSGIGYFYRMRNQMSVTYEPSAIRVSNTSGTTWTSGTAWSLKLDRKSQRSPIPSTYASPTSIPLPRPTSTTGNGEGLFPYDDFEAKHRAAASSGVLNPNGSP